jgi:hypothetical protein
MLGIDGDPPRRFCMLNFQLSPSRSAGTAALQVLDPLRFLLHVLSKPIAHIILAFAQLGNA